MLRELSHAELNAVSGGQNTASLSESTVATPNQGLLTVSLSDFSGGSFTDSISAKPGPQLSQTVSIIQPG
jgi:hypothetical protein